jgi:hypothetical protein
MPLQTGQGVELVDARGRRLGRLLIDDVNGEVIGGTFEAGRDFAQVENLFHAFTEAAEGHALGVADRLLADIAALDIHLESPESGYQPAVHDVQLWSDGAMSCRLRDAFAPVNGAAAGITAETAKSAPVTDN